MANSRFKCRLVLMLVGYLLSGVASADAKLRLGVYDYEDGHQPAWLCPEVAHILESALSDELATKVILSWQSSANYSEGAVAFNAREVDIAFFDKLGPVWVARPSLNSRLLDAFRAAVKEIDMTLREKAGNGTSCAAAAGALAWRSQTELEFFYLDDLPGAVALAEWVRKFQLAKINALPATASGE